MQNFSPEALQQVADYFQTLSEPTRLQILNLLRTGEHNVGELAEACQCSSANVSRHLSMLTRQGLVKREGRGNTVFYSISDSSVYELCDLVCGNIARNIQRANTGKKLFTKFR
jgi:DNA-binding transcriptional ArsR family regulator